MNSAQEWTAFGGASLAFMGAALATGARRHAADVAAWRVQQEQAVGSAAARQETTSGVERFYRGSGIGIFVIGVLVAASAKGVALASAGAPRGGAGLGACVATLGAAFAAAKWRRSLELFARPPDERAADAAIWALCALWLCFGLRLCWEGLR